MAANVQASASSIGMAPQATANGSAPAGALPSLTGGTQMSGAVPVSAAAAPAAAQAPGAAAQAPVPGAPTAGLDITSLASQGRWLGPLAAIGGGALAVNSFSKSAAAVAAAKAGVSGLPMAGGLAKWGAVGLALGGLALTGVGFKAKGIDVGRKATEAEAVQAINQLSQQYEATMQNLAAEASTEISSLKQQLAAAGQSPAAGTGAASGAIDPATGQPVPDGAGQAAPAGVGLGSTVVPGASQQGGSATDGTGSGAPAADASAAPAAGPWTLQSVIGRSVELPAGTTPAGTVIADPGSYRIEQAAGDPNGHATLDEANAAARATMSTELMGSRFLRWMVVEHEGRFYGVIAKQLEQQDQGAPLGPELGKVVAWSAMNHVTENGQNGWQAYTWSQQAGHQSMVVPYGTTSVFPGSGIGATDAAGASVPATVGGGGPVAFGRFDPASQVGRTFSINASSTQEGDLARGGVLQLQKFVEASVGGFGTPEEAATAARAARRESGAGDQWTRWVSLKGSDGRYYVYQGSIVKRETAQLQDAAPMHVFGAGFAQYFDGATSSWRALRDGA